MTQSVPILLFLIASFFGTIGQWLYKRGSSDAVHGFLNPSLFGGVAAFIVVMALFVTAYRLGGRISIAYPFYALTFVWGALIGVFIEGEPWHWTQGAGVLVIAAGLSLLAASA